MDLAHARQYLHSFDLAKLFIEALGWDQSYGSSLSIPLGDQTLTLPMIAQKRGFSVYLCPPVDGRLPDSETRRKIEIQARKFAHEHLLIYTNPDHSRQKWQWVRHEAGKPAATREFDYDHGQSGEALLQRLQLAAFEFEEEEALTIVDVTSRVRAAFDLERVTKRFFERFKAEHNAFLQFLQGIPDAGMQRWYVSVTINRLMFVYFIQKKGFLDNDPDYLRSRLNASQSVAPDQFYRGFLCPLFFEGFAQKEALRSAEVNALLGKVPYLNGGIFQKHQIEDLYGQAIQVPDAAFEQVFDFFDQYRWHLDERPLRADNEINPDVLGYIFEKYINQKEMGAYYTKEDITGYISQSTIVPYLLAQVLGGQNTFSRYSQELLQADPDRYIYAAVRHGVDLELPAEIAAGLNDVSQRGGWNKPAPAEYALPTETWREVAARRQRCQELCQKLARGDIQQVSDLITDNLDVRQFAQDVIESCPTPEALRAWREALARLKTLDPTVGSGAFLFAALNVLEPLYEALLERMQAFVDDLEQSEEKHRPEKLKDFRELLGRVAQHPNRRYYILKSIMVHNLYGVDIMEEAVEVCKLRLFLKLVAQVEQAQDIEPLPDIDFNVRVGNTLVGFATLDDVQRALTSQGNQARMMFASDQAQLRQIEQKAELAAMVFRQFQEQQTLYGGAVTAVDKQALRDRLHDLDAELNLALTRQYGVDVGKAADYQKWLSSHKPFHWCVEFYDIMKSGGFNVIIGNPPYVEYNKIKGPYSIRGYSTEECGNLYGFIIERNKFLCAKMGISGMIIPHSAFCTDRMSSVMTLFEKGMAWISSYDIRPAKLFIGVDQRLAIYIHLPSVSHRIYSTKYHRWSESERPQLFERLNYQLSSDMRYQNSYPKVGTEIEYNIWQKMAHFDRLGSSLAGASKVYFHNAPRYWVRTMTFAPYFWNEREGEKTSTQIKNLSVTGMASAKAITAILNSNLFYWWFILLSDCRHLNLREIELYPLGLDNIVSESKGKLVALCEALMDSYKSNSKRKEAQYQATGRVIYDEYYPRFSKLIIDQIDQVLAKHYGFTPEELDFIINYDIKYRMGKSGDEEE